MLRRQGGAGEQPGADQQGGGGGGGVHRYQMRQKILAFGDDFWIENEQGQRVYRVDGKALRIRKTLKFEDTQGHELARIQERLLRIKDSMEIQGPNGESLAMVKKALITPLRERFVVKIGDGPDLDVQGNLLDHEYRIEEGGRRIAEVSKKWFRIRDTYGVEIDPGQNDLVVLAVTVAIDMMTHRGR